jgi:urocanate hydratase
VTKLGAQGAAAYQPVQAPRGSERSCKGWQQEAAMRMLMNSLDPDVAERPEELIVCGGRGKAARDWECFRATIASLRELEGDETLLVQSGKPVAVFRTHACAPRVLIASSNAGGRANDSAALDAAECAGLTTFAGGTAEGWLYAGTQTFLATAYETFAAAARKHFGGTLAGRLVAAGGMGAAGGAQALAATLNGAAFLGVEADLERIKRRVKAGFCEVMVNDLDEALRILKNAVRKREAASVGLIGNCADVIPELARRGIVPDLLTDQTGADDPLHGYIPRGLTIEHARQLRCDDARSYCERALDSIVAQVRGMLELKRLGAVTFDFGNGIREWAFARGVRDAYDIPSFMPEYIGPLLSEGRVPLLWVALSGDAADIARADRLALEIFSGDDVAARSIELAAKHARFQGLPARTCWVGHAALAKFGVALNELVARGELKAPVVIGSQHPGGASAALPARESEKTWDASGPVADWAILSALLGTASGASWVSVQDGSAGIAHSLHRAQATVADGTPEMAERIERVLSNDASLGVVRLGDAGYSAAIEAARLRSIKIPMR